MFRFIQNSTIRQVILEQIRYGNKYQQFKTEVFQKPLDKVIEKKLVHHPINPLLTHK